MLEGAEEGEFFGEGGGCCCCGGFRAVVVLMGFEEMADCFREGLLGLQVGSVGFKVGW